MGFEGSENDLEGSENDPEGSENDRRVRHHKPDLAEFCRSQLSQHSATGFPQPHTSFVVGIAPDDAHNLCCGHSP